MYFPSPFDVAGQIVTVECHQNFNVILFTDFCDRIVHTNIKWSRLLSEYAPFGQWMAVILLHIACTNVMPQVGWDPGLGGTL